MSTERNWRFLTRPRWIAGHLLVLILAGAFIALGIWQLDRNDEKHAKDAAAKASYAAPAPELGGTDPPPATRAQATGSYEAKGVVLLRNRVRGDEGGYDVLTPLAVDGGPAVLVDRGWVPRNVVDTDRLDLAPPSGPITVRGIVGKTSPLEPDDTVDERAGHLSLPRVDVQRIADESDVELRDVYITAQYQDPTPASGGPQLPTPPPSDDVNHLEYAFQWFAFALIPLVGWPIVLWRVARKEPRSTPRPDRACIPTRSPRMPPAPHS